MVDVPFELSKQTLLNGFSRCAYVVFHDGTVTRIEQNAQKKFFLTNTEFDHTSTPRWSECVPTIHKGRSWVFPAPPLLKCLEGWFCGGVLVHSCVCHQQKRYYIILLKEGRCFPLTSRMWRSSNDSYLDKVTAFRIHFWLEGNLSKAWLARTLYHQSTDHIMCNNSFHEISTNKLD